MTSTRINDTLAIIPRRASGYERDRGVLRLRDWISPTLSATADGGVVSSALDLAKWDAALDGDRFLPRATLQQMWTPGKLANGKPTTYGFGWVIGERGGHRLVEHVGGFPGVSASISRYPDDNLSVIVLANISTAGAEKIGQGIAALYVPALAEPAAPPVADDDPPTTAKHKGRTRRLDRREVRPGPVHARGEGSPVPRRDCADR